MFKVAVLFKKVALIALVAALGLAALPASHVHAAGSYQEANPPDPAQVNERLERIWAREQALYERLGAMLDRADGMTEKVQALIERADEKGLDASALQSALDAFEEALKDAHPVYESSKGIIASHQGFDENGKVTDAEKARETVKELGEKLRAVRSILGEPFKALREAVKAFRQANKPAGEASEPSLPTPR